MKASVNSLTATSGTFHKFYRMVRKENEELVGVFCFGLEFQDILASKTQTLCFYSGLWRRDGIIIT